MPSQPTFPIYDRLLKGGLVTTILALRAEGLSPPKVRDRLRDSFQIDVSEATVRRWIARIEDVA